MKEENWFGCLELVPIKSGYYWVKEVGPADENGYVKFSENFGYFDTKTQEWSRYDKKIYPIMWTFVLEDCKKMFDL